MSAPFPSTPPVDLPPEVLRFSLQLPTPEVGTRQPGVPPEQVHAYLRDLFAEDLHAKRVLSLANGTVGVLHGAALTIHAVGRGLAAAQGTLDKHGVKQVDRLLSNPAIDCCRICHRWCTYVIGKRNKVYINLDWTDFDADDHTMLVASLQTNHGRSTPLMWKTFRKSKLKGKRNDFEDELLRELRAAIPKEVRVTIVADRGFGDQKLFAFLNEELDFDYIIRFKANILVTDAKGVTKKAKEWLGPGGRLRRLQKAAITADQAHVPLVIVVQDKEMKDIWCIASSEPHLTGAEVKKRYGKRFSCEEMFRDIKDIRYGMGLSWTSIKDPARRDRLFLLAVLAFGLLVLLGAAGESLGYDRILKTNTSPKRQLSLFRQGLRWYDLLPKMPEERARALMQRFGELVLQQPLFADLLGHL